MSASVRAAVVALAVAALAATACGSNDSSNDPGAAAAGSSGSSGSGSGSGGASGTAGASGSAGDDGGAGASGTGGAGLPDASPDGLDDAAEDGGDAAPDAPPDASADAGPDGPGGPNVCGDGWRDPVAEECDDGDGLATPDSCNAQCQVMDLLAMPLPSGASPVYRTIGSGRHAIAAGDSGFAVPFLSHHGAPYTLHVKLFGPTGKPLAGVVDLTTMATGEIDEANAVLAALPGGKYAVAWTELNGDGALRGVTLRIVDSATMTAGPRIVVNTTTAGNQQEPDVAWTGSEIVVVWTSLGLTAPPKGDVRVRRFSAAGTPIGGEQIVSPNDTDGDASLLPFGGDVAVGWRHSAGQAQVRIRVGADMWSTGFSTYGPNTEQPALVELDATHLLALFTHPSVYGGVNKLFGTVLDTTTATTTELQEFELPVLASGYAGYDRYEPSVARVGSRIYVAWRSKGPPFDYDELWLKELAWEPATATLDLSALEIPLPRWPEHRVGMQKLPSLAAAPLWPEGALATVWQDQAKVFGSVEAPHDFIVTFMPTPVVRIDSDGGLGK